MKQITVQLKDTTPADFLIPCPAENGQIRWLLPKWTEVTEPTEVRLVGYKEANRAVQHIVDLGLLRRHQLGEHDLSPLIRFTIAED